MRAMRAACREYLDGSRHHYSHDLSIGLGRLRALFGLQIAFLAIEYGIDLEGSSTTEPRYVHRGRTARTAQARGLRR